MYFAQEDSLTLIRAYPKLGRSDLTKIGRAESANDSFVGKLHEARHWVGHLERSPDDVETLDPRQCL
jgi:hypothetical protein